eukprot:scaffold17249_cov126-Isochrysis_galbana.AAC.4
MHLESVHKATAAADMSDGQRFRVCAEGLELTITLDDKWSARPFAQAVVAPFVKKYNSRAAEGQRQLCVEALKTVLVDGSEVARTVIPLPSSSVVPLSAARVDLVFGEPPPTQMKLRVSAADVSIKMTLDAKWLSRSFADAVVSPFLTVYNKRSRVPRTAEQLVEIHVDGVKLENFKAVISSRPLLDAVGWACSEVDLFFSYEAVRAASVLPAPTFRRVFCWTRADYQQATELIWDHKGFNRADGEEMAKAIIGATPLRKLKYMYLYGNHLGDEGIASLARALKHEHTPALKELHLHGNRIRNAGLIALAEVCKPSPKLSLLSLHDNSFGDEGLIALASAITAKTFFVEAITLYANPAVTAAGRERINIACAGADFTIPTPERGPVPFIPLDHTPQRWVERE